ncbi:FecR family protein [Tunicatimonas pelagia]|uniref:FecR family protein n=1 Tax=Tunicatimonas pelagia TaxID=931531 RepID=UPI0026667200|nr:FecR domain-containing protein [Tunicatimonas pelagia]WKN46277.1 FecR domain-containing protein [Tunicatimonas pelagia]
MSNSLLRQLVEKYISGRATRAEQEQLEQYLDKQAQNPPQLDYLSEKEKRLLEKRILQKVQRNIQPTRPGAYHTQKLAPTLVAASVLLVLLVGGYFWLSRPSAWQQYQTNYNETLPITLPDQSVVTLNAHSRLWYRTYWSDSLREVWVEGEAFFDVKPNTELPFVVHAREADIRVLGTQFNVHDRRGTTEVVLSEGAVQLETEAQRLSLAPGDLVAVSEQKPIVRKRVVPERYTAWRNRQLVFDDVPLEEIGKRLEDIYGYQITITDLTLHKRRFTGSAPMDSVEVLLEKFQFVFGVSIQQEGQRIRISSE